MVNFRDYLQDFGLPKFPVPDNCEWVDVKQVRFYYIPSVVPSYVLFQMEPYCTVIILYR